MSYQRVWEDPPAGTVLAVPAGEPLDLMFTCVNDAEKVVTFTARVDGLGPWAPDKEPRLPVVPFESGLIKVTVQSAATAEPGDYPFSVHLFLNGEPVETNGSVSLVMRLLPALVQVAPPVKPEPPVIETPPPVEEMPAEIASPPPPIEEIEAPVATEKPKDKPKKSRPTVAKEKPETLGAPETPVEESKNGVVDEPVPPVEEMVAEPVSEPTVEPAPEARPVFVPEPEPEPVIEPEPQPEPEPVIEPEPQPEPEPEPIPEPDPIPEPPKPEPKAEVKPEPTSTGGPKLIDLAPPLLEAKPQPEPEPEPIPEPEPVPIPIPTPEPVAPKVVDYGVREEEPEELEDVAAAYPSDHHFANPKEGTVLYARPGETILVRFSVSNDQTGVRTYVLQEDRSLPSEWIHLVRDQVNITPGGTGDVAFLLKPPINAEPASYPFSVSFGVLGKPLSNCYLTLTIQAAPAVTVEAKKSSVSVGPLSNRVPFELQVESAGNSDTAYRLAVMDDSPAADGTPQEPVPIYETPKWVYLFDKEIDNIQSPSAGRTPPPMPHRLNLRRKGTWWFGWREKHTVKVAAVPVTDKHNNQKPGNVITLTGARWRVFPLPMFLMIPLILISLVLLGSGGDNLRVTNGLQGDDGSFYVVGTEPNQEQLNVRLKWEAPIYALLKLSRLDQGKASPLDMSRQTAADRATVQDYGQAQKVSYELASKFFGTGVKTDVRFVPMKTDGMLQVQDGPTALGFAPSKEPIGEDKVEIMTQEVTVMVKRDETKALDFRNLTRTAGVSGQTIVAWTVRQPQGFKINDFLIKQGDNQVINPGATLTAKIRVDDQNPPLEGEGVWEILTTDAKYQLIRIKLKVVE